MSGHELELKVQAEKFLEESVELEKCAKFYEALVALNKSSIAAAGDAALLSKVFHAKSQIYYKLGHHQHCLSCIEEFKKFNNNSTGAEAEIQNLMKNCLSAMKSQKENIYENFLKLSYLPHPKIPFIVGCLQLKENEIYGKHIITDQDLKPGDIIAIEKSYFHFISPSAVFERCFNCFRSNQLNLKAFDSPVMFCAVECYDEFLKIFKHNMLAIKNLLVENCDVKRKMSIIMNKSLNVFGNFAKLRETFDNETVNKTVFDFDFNELTDEMIKQIVFICNTSLMSKSDSTIRKYLETTIHIPNIELRTFLTNFISRLILNYLRNGMKVPSRISNNPNGGMFLPFVSLLNHSCDPNVYIDFVENQCIVFVIKPIKANQQIFNNYRKTFIEMKKSKRQSDLMASYEFLCDCDACSKNYPMPNKLDKFDKSFKLPTFGNFQGDDDAMLNELKMQLKYINDNHDEHHPSFEISATLIRVRELLKTICERISFFHGK